MSRNILESGTAQDVMLTAETVCMIFSACAGLKLAELVVTDIGRGDLLNTAFEAVGVILGVALAVISGKAALENADSTPQNK